VLFLLHFLLLLFCLLFVFADCILFVQNFFVSSACCCIFRLPNSGFSSAFCSVVCLSSFFSISFTKDGLEEGEGETLMPCSSARLQNSLVLFDTNGGGAGSACVGRVGLIVAPPLSGRSAFFLSLSLAL